MPIEKQDMWMRKFINHYNSEKYKDRWYRNGIIPPCEVYDWIYEFIVANGTQVGETDDRREIWQYNHWRVDVVYGQGEAVYNFEYTEETIHPYGERIVYAIEIRHDGKLAGFGNEWFKSYYAANKYCVQYTTTYTRMTPVLLRRKD